MVKPWTDHISKDVAEYLNGYPAFNSENGIINGWFFQEWFSRNGYNVVDEAYPNGVLDPEYLGSTGLSEPEFWDFVAPAINTVWIINGDSQPVTMDMAEKLLRYIEPAWCRFKGIDSTGYLSNNSLMTASELLDDDMLDI